MTHISWKHNSWDPRIAAEQGTDYDLSTDTIESAAIAGGGYGGWVGKIWMGRHINPKGSGDVIADFEFRGQMDGYVVAGGNGSADASIKARVTNLSTNTTTTTTIGSWSADTIEVEGPRRGGQFSETVTMELDSDYEYRADLKLRTAIEVTGSGVVSSDFGGSDGDDHSEGVTLDSITITES